MNTLDAKLPAIRRLKLYELALIKWKEHKGLEGQGGSWSATERKYDQAPCPTPADFDLKGFETCLAEKIKGRVLPTP